MKFIVITNIDITKKLSKSFWHLKPLFSLFLKNSRKFRQKNEKLHFFFFKSGLVPFFHSGFHCLALWSFLRPKFSVHKLLKSAEHNHLCRAVQWLHGVNYYAALIQKKSNLKSQIDIINFCRSKK